MKRLDTSSITSSIAMPIKAGTLEFLQDANKETIASVMKALLGFTPDSNTIYILNGCINSNTAPSYNVSAGVVYYNGEIYEVSAFSFTTTGTDLAYPNLTVTQYTTNADPVQFTDGTPRNVHNIRSFTVTATSTNTGYPVFSNWLQAGAWIKGDTKEIVCDSTYMGINFDSTGLGRKERKGWAIMNGSNGTPNDNGKVVIAYGTDYTTLGATGGSRDSVVVAHTHGQRTSSSNGNDTPQIKASGSTNPVAGYSGNTSDGGTREQLFTDSAGVSGVDKNMMPYVVRLRIMKI
jgi:hypothetical protein